MATKNHLLIIAIVALKAAAYAPTVYAAGPATPPKSLLLRYTVRTVEGFPETISTRESLIFRDGLIIERTTTSSGQCAISRRSASPIKMIELQNALTTNEVALQRGNCASDAPGDAAIERTVTWFGRGARQNSYTTGTALGAACSPKVVNIDLAINATIFSGTLESQARFTCP